MGSKPVKGVSTDDQGVVSAAIATIKQKPHLWEPASPSRHATTALPEAKFHLQEVTLPLAKAMPALRHATMHLRDATLPLWDAMSHSKDEPPALLVG